MNPDPFSLDDALLTPEAPWPGLRPYTEATKDYFHGRANEIHELVLRVRDNPLTVIFGPSGLGKSSILGAGLMPALREMGYSPVLLRIDFESEMTPLEQLRAAFLDGNSTEELTAVMESSDSSLWEIFHRLGRSNVSQRARPVLILDQCEELFTLADSSSLKEAIDSMARELADFIENRVPDELQNRIRANRSLARGLDLSPSPARVIISLREDYLSHLETWTKFFPSLMYNRFRLAPLRGANALESILGPAGMGERSLVAEDVAEAILRVVAEQPRDTPLEDLEVQPPLLSLLCDELNRARGQSPFITAELVEERRRDILQTFYLGCFLQCPEAQAILEDKLLSDKGYRLSLSREDAESLLDKAGVEEPAGVLEALISRRVISSERRGRIDWIELAHDVLAPIALDSKRTRLARERQALAERQQREAEVRADQEAAARLEMERLREETLAIQGRMGFALAVWRLQEKKPEDAVAFLTSVLRGSPTRAAIDRLVTLMYEKEFAIPEDKFDAGAFLKDVLLSKDGRWILTWSTAPGRTEAVLWDARTCLKKWEFQPGGGTNAATISPDGTRVALAGGDHIWVMDSETGNCLVSPPCHEDISGMVFNPMGDRLLTVTSEGNAILWDACSGSLLFNPSRHEARIKDASFCPDGVCFLTVAADTKVKIWNPEIPSRPLRVLEHEVEVDHACFYNNGKEVVTVDTYGTTRIWDLDSTEFKILEPKLRGKVALLRAITRRDFVCAGTLNDAVWSYNVPLFSKSTKNHQFYRGSGISSDGPVVSIDVASDGASCVAAFQDQTVHIARVGGYSSWNQPILLAGSVTKVIYGVRSGTVWTVTKDGTITRWSWQRLYLQLRRHPVHSSSVSIPGMVKGAVFSPAGDRVLAWLKDRTAKVFNAMDGTLLATTAVHDAELQEATFDPTGSRVATISQDGVWLWDATTGERLIGPLTHPSGKPIAAIAFSQDGAQLATGGLDHDAIVWDSEFGRQIAGPLRHGGQVMELAFDKSGLNLACAAGDGYVHLWTLGGFPRDKFPCKMGECPELIIDPGWKRLLGDGLDSTIRVYSLERDVKSVASIPHRSSAVRASFSPDGTQVITSISDRSIQTWSVENGRPITPPIKHDKNIKSATFDASGERILTTCEGGTLQVWDAVTGWPLLDRFNLDRSEIRAQFDPKGRRILVLSETGCHVLDLGLGLPPPPSWFLDLAEAIVCRKLDDQALPVPLDGSPTRIRDIRSTLLSLGQEDDGYLSIARHLLAMD